jgi:hypothetical protein
MNRGENCRAAGASKQTEKTKNLIRGAEFLLKRLANAAEP